MPHEGVAMSNAVVPSASVPAPSRADAPAQMWRIYVLEAKYEFLKLLRTPHYAVPILALPVMFYLLFGLSFSDPRKEGGFGAAEYLIAGYSVFGVVTAALFALGAGVAMERAQGWLVLKRATPMPISAYLLSKVMASMIFGAVIVVLLATCAITLGGVRMPVTTWLALMAVISFGCIPFCLAGLIIAFVVPPAGAAGIVNLINLPLAFASGLWMPVSLLPRMFQTIAPFLPQYHIAQLALGAIGAAPPGEAAWHAAMLAVATLVFGAGAWVAWRRSDVTQG
jgi:ABC-2 type transport system permease protein